jgi:sec-independent protein translocase protein TatA
MAVFASDLLQFIVGTEWIILILVVLVLIFGSKKIPELARGLGRAKTEFEKAKVEAEKELNIDRGNTTSDTAPPRDKLELIANTLGIDHINKDDETLRLAIDRELKKGKTV